jgi:hypothetical protein
MHALRHSLALWASTPLALAAACASLLWPVQSHADALGYLVNVAAGEGYGRLVGDVKGDVNAANDYAAAYLINQAVNELCPQLIWQLRNSAAHYRSPAP